jgi:hypothetical protein
MHAIGWMGVKNECKAVFRIGNNDPKNLSNNLLSCVLSIYKKSLKISCIGKHLCFKKNWCGYSLCNKAVW